MKIFVAGATGVLGRALVPQLVRRGHEVVAMTRSASRQRLVADLGGRPVVADALDADAVAQAVAAAEPEVIVHQLTIANSGSVGSPFDGDPRASYLLLESGRAEVVRVQYEVEREIDLLRRSDYPDRDRIVDMRRRGKFVAVAN